MGIHGLTSYVDSMPSGEGNVWEPYKLRNTNVVIDGCGLYYYLYASNYMNVKYGGQYAEMQEKVKEFFSKLKLNNVVAYVIFDGIMGKDEKKFNTKLKRKETYIQKMTKMWTTTCKGYDMLLPRLMEIAVIEVLKEINVQYAVSDFEADAEIALLANELKAPVMSNDSDFYIFNVKHGYIPFGHYTFTGCSVTVKKFNFMAFIKYLNITEKMPPLLASLVGNDYVSDGMLMPFIYYINKNKSCKGLHKIAAISLFLSKYDTISEAVQFVLSLYTPEQKLKFEKQLRLSIEEYQKEESFLIAYFQSCDHGSNLRAYNGFSLPTWLIKLFRDGSIAPEGIASLCNRKLFLRMQSEDVKQSSSQMCVESLRWKYYAFLCQCEMFSLPTGSHNLSLATQNQVVSRDKPDHRNLDLNASKSMNRTEICIIEIDRKSSDLIESKVNIDEYLHESKLQVYDLCGMSDELKRDYIIHLLHGDTTTIYQLSIQHQLIALALRYCIIQAQVKPYHLASLLLYYVGVKQDCLSTEHCYKEATIDVVHTFSEWQNILYWVKRFNMLLRLPFPCVNVSDVYDGVKVCSLYARVAKIGASSAETLALNLKLYQQLYDAITNHLPPDCTFHKKCHGGRVKAEKKDLVQKNTMKKKESGFLNWFAWLWTESSSDSDAE